MFRIIYTNKGFSKFNLSLLSVIFLSCGTAEKSQTIKSNQSVGPNSDVSQDSSGLPTDDKFGKAYQDLEQDFSDFVSGDLQIWGSQDESRYSQYKLSYDKLWQTLTIRGNRLDTVDWYLEKINKNKARYQEIERQTGVPWYWIGITHGLEAGFNFSSHLHNGDPLNARTFQVPAGRPKTGKPPFTWEFSAIDALKYEGFDKWNDWTKISILAYTFEKYNGFGYRNSSINIPSPYLWSFGNHYSKGKFVKDGIFDRNAVSGQAGAMVILKRGLEKGLFQISGKPIADDSILATDFPELKGLLKIGTQDLNSVKLLQLRLRSFGYKVEAISGEFDATLERFVQDFQEKFGLERDGAVGPLTWRALWSKPSEAESVVGVGHESGLYLTLVKDGQCIFKIQSKLVPVLAEFLKNGNLQAPVTFDQRNLEALKCPDIREQYTLSTGKMALLEGPTAPLSGTISNVTWHAVSEGVEKEFEIHSYAGSTKVSQSVIRLARELTQHFEKHAKANHVLTQNK
jgi:lysozyme family protein